MDQQLDPGLRVYLIRLKAWEETVLTGKPRGCVEVAPKVVEDIKKIISAKWPGALEQYEKSKSV